MWGDVPHVDIHTVDQFLDLICFLDTYISYPEKVLHQHYQKHLKRQYKQAIFFSLWFPMDPHHYKKWPHHGIRVNKYCLILAYGYWYHCTLWAFIFFFRVKQGNLTLLKSLLQLFYYKTPPFYILINLQKCPLNKDNKNHWALQRTFLTAVVLVWESPMSSVIIFLFVCL